MTWLLLDSLKLFEVFVFLLRLLHKQIREIGQKSKKKNGDRTLFTPYRGIVTTLCRAECELSKPFIVFTVSHDCEIPPLLFVLLTFYILLYFLPVSFIAELIESFSSSYLLQ